MKLIPMNSFLMGNLWRRSNLSYLVKQIEDPIIKLDLDSQEALNEFMNRVWIIKNLGLKIEKLECYETNHGYHIYLYLDNILTNFDILMIESLLGSDFRKQLYGYLKVKNGTKNWDVLFKEKFVYNHLDHKIPLSAEKYSEKLNETISRKLMNLISFGEERKTGIFKRKPGSDEGLVQHEEGID